MNYSIIPYDNNFFVHTISKDMSELLLDDTRFKNPLFRLVSLCCLDKENNKIIFYKNNLSEYCIFFNHKLDDAFLNFIKEFFNKKYIDIYLSYNFLLIAKKICDEKEYLFKLFIFLDWPSGKKGYDYFKSMKEFSDLLRGTVLRKKISLSEAYLFHNFFKDDYDELLTLLPEDSSFSELSKVLRYLTEYSKREKRSIKDIINLLQKNYSRAEASKRLLIDFIYNLRFPEYSKLKYKMENYIKELRMPKGFDILYDESFEKEDYRLSLRFNDLRSLAKKVESIYKILEEKLSKVNLNDLFIHENLFRENEQE